MASTNALRDRHPTPLTGPLLSSTNEHDRLTNPYLRSIITVAFPDLQLAVLWPVRWLANGSNLHGGLMNFLL